MTQISRQEAVSLAFERAIPEPNSGCWLWTGSTAHGYGRVLRGGRWHSVTRLILGLQPLAGSARAQDLCACHSCDTPACVNPDHLFAGTAHANARDRDAKGRHRCNTHPIPMPRLTHCGRGHELTDDNVYKTTRMRASHMPGRTCKKCALLRSQRRRQRTKSAS